MGQHRALRAARGAGGVENGGQIVGRARHGGEIGRSRRDAASERAVSVDAETFDRLQAELSREVAQRSERSRPADRQRGAGVGEEIFELGERVGGVERQQRGARLQAGEREHDHVGRLVDLHRDAIARLDAEIGQRPRRAARALEQFPVGQRHPVRRVESELVEARRAGEKKFEEIG